MKLEGTVFTQNHPHFNTHCKLRVLKTILGFKTLLEGLRELSECCHSCGSGYYRKRIQIKIS